MQKSFSISHPFLPSCQQMAPLINNYLKGFPGSPNFKHRNPHRQRYATPLSRSPAISLSLNHIVLTICLLLYLFSSVRLIFWVTIGLSI